MEKATQEGGTDVFSERDQSFRWASNPYLSFGDYSSAALDQPVQPLFFKDVTAENCELRGAERRSAEVDRVQSDFNATIATLDNEFVDNPAGTVDPLADGSRPSWYPSIDVNAQSLGSQSLMAAQLGQYNSSSQQERIFGKLQVQLYYSTSSDEIRPSFTTKFVQALRWSMDSIARRPTR